MDNTILTPTAVTREALRVLHESLKLAKNVQRQYDERFAVSGAKIGESLTVRLPNQFPIRSTATLSATDISEPSTTITIGTQKGVDVNFTTRELTMSMDEFSKRILSPAMKRLAAEVEKDLFAYLYKKVYNLVDDDGSAFSFRTLGKAKKLLDENLAPESGRVAILCPQHSLDFLDATKGLFNAQKALAQQYTTGVIGNVLDLDVMQSVQFTDHTTGTAAKTTGYTVNGASEGADGNVTVQTGTTTFKAGDVVTFAGCNAVHPETKVSLGYLKQFVLTADYAGGAGDIAISPSITTSGAYQNVSGYPTNGGAVVKVGAGASQLLNSSMAFHPEAFALVTADLIDVSQYGAWGARETVDGISLRIARQYDITNDKVPCRIDVFYGYAALRPQMAVRIHADG